MKTRNYMKTLSATAAIVAMVSGSVLTPLEAFALTQGTLGTSSQGIVDIDITIPVQAQITALDDTNLTVASWITTSGQQALYTPACVYATGGATAPGDFTLTVTTANGTTNGAVDNGFYLYDDTQDGVNPAGSGAGVGGAAHNIPYTATWATTAQGHTFGTGTAIVYNTPLSVTGADTVSATCLDGGAHTNFYLNIGIAAADLQAATAGHFTDTVTMVVAPN
jgi:hypothetical protein